MGIKKDFQIVLINDIKIKEYKIENLPADCSGRFLV